MLEENKNKIFFIKNRAKAPTKKVGAFLFADFLNFERLILFRTKVRVKG